MLCRQISYHGQKLLKDDMTQSLPNYVNHGRLKQSVIWTIYIVIDKSRGNKNTTSYVCEKIGTLK